MTSPSFCTSGHERVSFPNFQFPDDCADFKPHPAATLPRALDSNLETLSLERSRPCSPKILFACRRSFLAFVTVLVPNVLKRFG